MQKTSKLALYVSQSILILGWLANVTPALAQEILLDSQIDPNFPSQLETDSPLISDSNPILANDSPLVPESHPGIKTTDAPTPLANTEDLTDSTNAMKQVTSVSQLSDVQPTDWAFQALQSLVERYGCIAGYPDGTFRGNRALTRYEFAAGLNACLDQISQQIGTATANLANKEDLVKLQKLQEEFAAELATLRGRVDALEARSAELEANQFSTTTKLYGLTFFNLTDTRASGKIKAEGTSAFTASRDANGRPIQRRLSGDTETTFSYLTWLSLVTSFTGKDTLLMVLGAGNGDGGSHQLVSAGQTFRSGLPFPVQTAGSSPNALIVRDFYYSFPVGSSLRVIAGPRVSWFSHFDENVFSTSSLSGLSSFSSINSPLGGNPARGSGAVVEWYLNKNFELHAGYLAENEEYLPGIRTAADPTKGLFGRNNSLTAELTYKPSANANIRLLYIRNNLASNSSGQVEGVRPIAGILDDGPGGLANGGLKGATADIFSANFDWRVTPRFGLFGRYSYASTNLQTKNGDDGNVRVQAFHAGMAFPDLGKKGALGTLSFILPMDILGGSKYFVSGAGNGANQYEIEANYYLPMTDHIAIVPAFYVIGNWNNFSDNPTVFVGHVRTHFSF